MTRFAELEIGDMFQTLDARYAKVSYTEAVVVMSIVKAVASVVRIHPDREVSVIWSNKQDAEQQATIDRWMAAAKDEEMRRTFGIYAGPLAEVT